jgi:UDP-2,3-diacylglucosamine hydrolase
MTKTYFISDIHLSADCPKREKLFLVFLDLIINEKADLYILGDLFDFWANNRKILHNSINVLNRLKVLTTNGSKAGFVFGNRDFLLGRNVLSLFGIDFLGEEKEINLDGKRVFITHGHTFCTADKKFLEYKKKAWPVFIILDKVLPGIIENYIAKKLMSKSKKTISAQDKSLLTLSTTAIKELFTRGIDTIICGHTHKCEHQVFGDHIFHTLPAWEDEKGWYLLNSQGKFNLHEFRI